jgi:hypothetical protein
MNATSCSQFAFRSAVVFIFHKISSWFNNFVLYTHLSMAEKIKDSANIRGAAGKSFWEYMAFGIKV